MNVKWGIKMNNTDKKNFYTNAAISSKSEKYPGLLFVAACADVGLLGNVTFHTSNTCKSKKIVIGDIDNRSLLQEYYDVCSHMKNKLKDKDKNLKKNKLTKTAIEKLNWFFEKLESLIKNLNNECGGLVNVIYPSGAKRMLEDLEQNVIGKMKAWALPSSGKNDEDYVDLVKDDYGMNVAKLYGAEKFRYSNGSGLVSWIQTGALFDSLLKNLNSLLDCEAENKIFINVVQTFMNVIFINNQCLPELDRIKILDNYKKFIDSIYEKKLSLVEYKDSLTIEDKKNELDRPVKFIKFLLKQLCKYTSLQNLDLDEENNKKKYIDVICGISNSLSVAQHPNQVLVEQWILNEDQTPLVISDAFLGKNNVLYLSLYKILQRFYLLQPGKFANDDKKEFNSMLNFMINLAGKFRYKKIDLNLSDIKNEDEYKFGCQITSNGKYTVPTKYDTDISKENLMNLAIQIVEFYEFENKLKSKGQKLDDIDVENILKYLLDGRQFNNDTMRKITQNKDFMEKLIDQAKNKNIGDNECCYQTAYEILVNEYLDVMIKNKYIDIKSVSKYNLIKYFESPDKYDQIIDLDAKTIVELKLFDKLVISIKVFTNE